MKDEGAVARLIVCERWGRWAVAIRREVADVGMRVWETRTVADCRDELTASPASFVVTEIMGDIDRFVRQVAGLTQAFPAARLAVVGERGQAEYEGLMREAGAVHFVVSPRQAPTLAAIALKHLARVPPPPQNLTERIWSGLPWA